MRFVWTRNETNILIRQNSYECSVFPEIFELRSDMMEIILCIFFSSKFEGNLLKRNRGHHTVCVSPLLSSQYLELFFSADPHHPTMTLYSNIISSFRSICRSFSCPRYSGNLRNKMQRLVRRVQFAMVVQPMTNAKMDDNEANISWTDETSRIHQS